MEGIILFAAGLFLLYLLKMWDESDAKKKKILSDKIDSALSKELEKNNLKADEIYRYDSNNNYLFLAIDKSHQKIMFISLDKISYTPSLISYNFRDIISVSIIQDGETLSKTGSAVGRALVGGLIAGGPGALIGGITSKKQQTVRRLFLSIIINNLDHPEYKIVFVNSKNGEETTSNYFLEMKDLIDHWYSIFKVIINQNNITSKEEI